MLISCSYYILLSSVQTLHGEKHLEDHDYKAWNPTMQHLMVSPETVRLPMNAYGVCQGYWEEYIKSRF